ncbi:EAL domain-containing protein [Roseomonas sp. SSH11]|uniref:EAL domain-containing protein n=1 Tax=Pararoseomonas baculiformis TaxID=2820812 RepID=A0ABS4AHN1_9PROT|nr:EAL domain-containing protein [Pararoseomonas baculiformis]MBP0446506.1 EAL domain-containing protein [Pararoseomonas baculiformis]
MMTVIGCITQSHNLALVLVAAAVCAAGSWSTVHLHGRAARTAGPQRAGWHFLSAVVSGAAIWCTHFVAMLGFDPGVPVSFDPVITILSLLIAMGGAQAAFIISAGGWGRAAPLLGGALLGLAIAAMHYTGMLAYRVQGILTWNPSAVVASVLLATFFSAASLHLAVRPGRRLDQPLAVLSLMLGITSLHFTGMAALTVSPLPLPEGGTDPATLVALALAVSLVAFIVVGAGVASYLIDDNARAETRRQLSELAHTDLLTGLPNREAFRIHLEQEIAAAARGGFRLALLSLDLDGFRGINEAHGHAAGDQALRGLARRISVLTGPGEFFARIGADEFVALKRMEEDAALDEFLARIRLALGLPLRIEAETIPLSASIGVALFPQDAQTDNALVTCAGLARSRARAEGAGQLRHYERLMEESARARRQLVADLREAVEAGQLSVHYQPQVRVSTGELRGFEALLRWTHPARGPVSPAEFIPLAEEHGLIGPIGQWVLRRACADAAAWAEPLKIAVNLSPAQLSDAGLPKLIQDTLQETGLAAERLELELTETMILGDRERALQSLAQISALGVSIALDDFGTGYSSLDTLRAFPFSKIKLDRSFMREVEASPQAVAIIRAVLALGRSLGILVLAEGIETEGQLAILRAEGCDEAQGYLHGRPVPVEALLAEGRVTLGAGQPAVPGQRRGRLMAVA